MHPSIKSRITSIKDPDSIRLFFHLLKLLIDHLDLGPENPRLALTMQKHIKRIVVNVNKRYALVVEERGLGFLFDVKDTRLMMKLKGARKTWDFTTAKKVDAHFVWFGMKVLQNERMLQRIVNGWLKACS